MIRLERRRNLHITTTYTVAPVAGCPRCSPLERRLPMRAPVSAFEAVTKLVIDEV